MILLVKLFAISLAVIAVSKSYLDYRKGLEPPIMFIFWFVVWTVSTVIIVYPLLIERINVYFQDSTITIGSLTGVAFIFLLFIIYRIYAKAARIEYQLIQLVRKISIETAEPGKKK